VAKLLDTPRVIVDTLIHDEDSDYRPDTIRVSRPTASDGNTEFT